MPIKIIDKINCCGCAACKSVCPKHCITMRYDEEGFQYPIIDVTKCVNCHKCEEVCPIINNPNEGINGNPLFFAARSSDNYVRENSSSGGVAHLIAKKFLTDGGVVCGVKMSADFSHAEYVCIERTEDLKSISGSKYIQSDSTDTYEKINEYIKTGRKILFIGTPCQVAAVKNYFHNRDDCITYIDIVCHGVPSQILWDKFRAYITKKYKGRITKVNFRDKRNGWDAFGFAATFDNCKEIYEPRNRGFLGIFLKNICLRPVCADCHHKGYNRCSDLTLGDFWGIERVLPDYDIKNGVSLVMVNNSKGLSLLHSFGDEMDITEADCKGLFTYRNKSLLKSVKISDRRSEFMSDLRALPFSALENKYLGKQFFNSIKKTIKRIIRR